MAEVSTDDSSRLSMCLSATALDGLEGDWLTGVLLKAPVFS